MSAPGAGAGGVVIVHVDGGARGNPGPAAIGVVVSGPDGEVLDAAIAMAEKMAAAPPQAVQSTKRALNMHMKRAVAGVLALAVLGRLLDRVGIDHVGVVFGLHL